MTTATVSGRRSAPESAPEPAVAAAVLATVLTGAAVVRVSLAGLAGAASVPAALVFAAVLGAAAVAVRPRVDVGLRSWLFGLAGAAVLVAPVLVLRGVAAQHPAGSYLTWALAVTVVAGAEEAFLRGALFDVLSRWRGTSVAVVGAAVAFAALHVPLYGWRVLPLDFAVGLLLGGLRLATGSWFAPAVAHVGADLVGWWSV